MISDDDRRFFAAAEAGRTVRAMIRAGTRAHESERASAIFNDLSAEIYAFLTAQPQPAHNAVNDDAGPKVTVTTP